MELTFFHSIRSFLQPLGVGVDRGTSLKDPQPSGEVDTQLWGFPERVLLGGWTG